MAASAAVASLGSAMRRVDAVMVRGMSGVSDSSSSSAGSAGGGGDGAEAIAAPGGFGDEAWLVMGGMGEVGVEEGFDAILRIRYPLDRQNS